MDLPLTSKINEGGVGDFINDMENEIIHIDKVGLGEIIEYHMAEFESIDGYYYDQGRNNTLLTMLWRICIIQESNWKNKNPARMVIKLLMNPMYGKTVIKPVETDTVAKENKVDFGNYAAYNYSCIDAVIDVNRTY